MPFPFDESQAQFSHNYHTHKLYTKEQTGHPCMWITST